MDGDNAAFQSPPGTRSFWSVGSARRVGVDIVVRDSFLARFNDPEDGGWEELLPGRAARLHLRSPAGRLDFYVLYCATGADGAANQALLAEADSPHAQRHRTRELLGQRFRGHRRVWSTLSGDFNWTPWEEDRFAKATDAFSDQDGIAEEVALRGHSSRAAWAARALPRQLHARWPRVEGKSGPNLLELPHGLPAGSRLELLHHGRKVRLS